MSDWNHANRPPDTATSPYQPALAMRRYPPRGCLNLRGQLEHSAFVEGVRAVVGITPPARPNTVNEAGPSRMLWLAPTEWLLLTPHGAEADMAPRLRRVFGEVFAAVTDVTSGYTTIELRGRQARAVLASGCTIDLHPRVFGPGQCAQTLLARAGVIIEPVDSAPTFQVIVRASLGAYLWAWLQGAAGDVGIADEAHVFRKV